jgi:hypothetical protein
VSSAAAGSATGRGLPDADGARRPRWT